MDSSGGAEVDEEFIAKVKKEVADAEPYGLGYSWWVIRELLRIIERK